MVCLETFMRFPNLYKIVQGILIIMCIRHAIFRRIRCQKFLKIFDNLYNLFIIIMDIKEVDE